MMISFLWSRSIIRASALLLLSFPFMCFSKTINVPAGVDLRAFFLRQPVSGVGGIPENGDLVVLGAGVHSASGLIEIDGFDGLTIKSVSPVWPLTTVVKRPIVISNSAGVDLSFIDVSVGNGACGLEPCFTAVGILGGVDRRDGISLRNNKIRGGFVGVSVGSKYYTDMRRHAGTGLVISDNTIQNNVSAGVAVSYTNANPSQRNLISGNTIRANGGHGIEMEGSYFDIVKNSVSENGGSAAAAVGSDGHGFSGIHLYRLTDNSDLACTGNRILRNYSWLNIDKTTSANSNEGIDGNGIQIDNYCDQNEVAYNVVWSNDGAGISVLLSSGNKVYSNTLRNNARDRYRKGVRAELIFSDLGAPGICGSRASNLNGFVNNIVAPSSFGDLPSEVVDGMVVTPCAIAGNFIGPNMYFHRNGGVNLRLGGTDTYSGLELRLQSEIDSSTGQVGNLVERPKFLNVSSPGPNSDGLQLTQTPSSFGWYVSGPDMLGSCGDSGMPGSVSYFGAYFSGSTFQCSSQARSGDFSYR